MKVNSVQNYKQKFTSKLDLAKSIQNDLGITNKEMAVIDKAFELQSKTRNELLNNSFYKVDKSLSGLVARIVNPSKTKSYADLDGKHNFLDINLVKKETVLVDLIESFNTLKGKLQKPYIELEVGETTSAQISR